MLNDKRLYILIPLASLALIAGAYAFFWNPGNNSSTSKETPGSAAAGADASTHYQSVQDLLSQLKDKLSIEPPAENDDGRKETEFPALELQGTIVAQSKDPLAYIRETDTQKQGVYRIGSTVGGAQIIMIGPGSVLLSMGDKTKELHLTTRSTLKSQPGQETAETSEVILAASNNRYIISKRGLARSAETITDSLVKVIIKPMKNTDKTVGMIIDNIPENSLMASLGLQNKDVVTSINNQQLESYQKALQIAQKARSQSEINVNILREGQTKEFSYRFAP